MKWMRLLTWILFVCFTSGCSVHVGPSDSTHKHSKKKHKKHKKHKKKHKKHKRKVHKQKSQADSPPPPPPSDSKLTSNIRGKIPGWVVNGGGKDNTVKPSKSKSKGAAANVKKAAPNRTKASGALRMAPMKSGQTSKVTYDLKAGDCTGFVVHGDRGIRDIAAILTEGKGNRMRVIAKDDPDPREGERCSVVLCASQTTSGPGAMCRGAR